MKPIAKGVVVPRIVREVTAEMVDHRLRMFLFKAPAMDHPDPVGVFPKQYAPWGKKGKRQKRYG